MSSERLPPTIDLVPGASYALALGCAAAYALAVAAVLWSGLPWPARIVLALGLIGFALWWITTQALRHGAHAVRRFVWQAEGECAWQDRRGRFRRCELTPGVWVTPTLVILRLRVNRLHSRSLCLASDAVPADDFRRLRMRLRVAPATAGPSPIQRLRTRLSVAIAKRRK